MHHTHRLSQSLINMRIRLAILNKLKVRHISVTTNFFLIIKVVNKLKVTKKVFFCMSKKTFAWHHLAIAQSDNMDILTLKIIN